LLAASKDAKYLQIEFWQQRAAAIRGNVVNTMWQALPRVQGGDALLQELDLLVQRRR